jgi:lysophospholipase L1-like esterase
MKKLILSFVLVFIYGLILLELGLFVSGKFVLQHRREKATKQAGVHFVCIGDSHTFGVGTSVPYAYPQQLEKLLNSNNPGQKFSVINLGVPGSSTRMQSEALQSFFENHRADVVLWLTGRNNTDLDIKLWGNKTLPHQIPAFLAGMKSVKFFKWAVDCLSKKDAPPEIREPSEAPQAYADYLDFYLETARRLCEAHGAKLILLSYYNSADIAVKEFADKHRVLFFALKDDFSFYLKGKETPPHISHDGSHVNRLGYQFYSERLYEDIFLNQKRLGLRLGPLLKKMKDADFYADSDEIKKSIRSQQKKIVQSQGTWAYSFEQIQLGNIYSEIGREESAKQCFMAGLVSSNYADNGILVSPIITWHLKRGQRQEAIRLCDEILAHNPGNSIAGVYREMLSRPLDSTRASGLENGLESID